MPNKINIPLLNSVLFMLFYVQINKSENRGLRKAAVRGQRVKKNKVEQLGSRRSSPNAPETPFLRRTDIQRIYISISDDRVTNAINRKVRRI